ncbi:MAG: 50S ribosomal protein L31e [Candidatus Micrarchaeota archaeon]
MAGDPTSKQDKFIELQEKKAQEKKDEQPAAIAAAGAGEPAPKQAGDAKPSGKQEGEDKEARKPQKKDEKKEEEKKEKKREIVLERIMTLSLVNAYNKPQMMRANNATRLLRALLSRHMKVPAGNVRIAPALNDSLRVRGSSHPPKKVKIKATKDKDGIVLAEPAA